jgi:glyoxylase-like metal-dependent hydrolase (beta-lactamase superfamily II)
MSNLIPSAEFGAVRIYSGEKSGKYPDGNQVIVEGTDYRAAFDSPRVANRIGADFDGADLVIQGHVHEDHMAGLHRLPDVPVYVHRDDLPAILSWQGLSAAYGYDKAIDTPLRESIERDFYYRPRPDAIAYDDGMIWDLGGGVSVRAIHAPGHTAGHCVLLAEPDGIAFIGDIDLSGFGPYYGDRSSSLADFRRTLAKLADIPAQVWVTSHHRGVYTDRQRFLDDLTIFAGKIELRQQRLLQLIEQQPRDLKELTAIGVLYKPDANIIWAPYAERRTIAQHLQEMVATGTIARDSQGRFGLNAS